MPRVAGWLLIALSCLFPTTVWCAETPGDAKIEYNRDIRPILTDNCFACHGPDSAARKAGLRLDKREQAIEAGAIEPGKPDDSEFIRRILSADPKEIMPPPAAHKELTPEQKEMLQKWVSAGAEYQPHWSFIPPVRPALPAVKNVGWVKNPIDQFVLAKLESLGLAPAPEADRRILARRVSLDLRGVPPTPAEVEAFVNDTAPDAYEKLVDTFLASEQWGEHRGRYWLDSARYADTHGIHFDNYREMWSYREWVIKAFNQNMPFDQFTIEQLAGDLLPNRTVEQQIASGFNRCNITSNEGGAIAEEYLVLYARDRTETVSLVWMGLTTGCAVCHDHKFDPVSQREFYELAAFFNNTTQNAMDGNIKDTPPVLVVPQSEDRARWDTLNHEIPAVKTQVEERKTKARPEFDTWLASANAEALQAKIPSQELYLHAPLSAAGTTKSTPIQIGTEKRDVPLNDSATWQPGPAGNQGLQVQGAAAELADVGDFEKDQAYTCSVWIKAPANDGGGALCARMESAPSYRGWDFWMQGRRLGTHIVHRWPDDALKVVARDQIPANQWTHVTVSYDGSGKAAGVKVYYNGLPQPTAVEADKLANTIKTTVPYKIGQRNASDPLSAAILNDLRIYKRALPPGEVESLAKASRFASVLAKPVDERTDAEKNELYAWWLAAFDANYQTLTAKVLQLEQEQTALKLRGTQAHVMQEKASPAMAFVLFRGEYDKRRDQVEPKTPAMFPPMPEDLQRNRLGLAQWLLKPDHPLTTRVTVNRAWQELFGTGLVRTTGDFGIAGDLPSNQELLDWMAVDFREGNWDLKRFYKMVVTSATYRQSAAVTPEKLDLDPSNRFLSRGPRFRMDAEMVRDYALSASGLLVQKIGGPSVKPYQPDGVWEAVAMIGSNTRDYRRDTGDNLYRRSLYTFWKRSAPPASMDVFNAPARETCTVRRERTNTPLQALVTLNDPQFVEAARHLAQTALKQSTDVNGQIDFIARKLLSRPLRTDEQTIVRASLKELLAFYDSHEKEAQELLAFGDTKPDAQLKPQTLAAWTMLTNQLMNLDEVLNK